MLKTRPVNTMPPSVRLGVLTPSSNTVLEPLTLAMIADLPGVTAHFSRFRVTEIGLNAPGLQQFEHSEIVRAGELLADAKVHVIAWSGTSASWLGFERDEELCRRIEDHTGIPACTSVLAFREIFERTSVRRVGLVTPYLDDVQQRIISNWDGAGFHCTAERHLGLSDNYSFAEVPEATIADMVRDVVRDGGDAVAIVCTNLKGAKLALQLEKELDVPVYDSISVTVWKSLALAGVESDSLSAWGGLFTNPLLNVHAKAIA
jgi:maleate isomerase